MKSVALAVSTTCPRTAVAQPAADRDAARTTATAFMAALAPEETLSSRSAGPSAAPQA